MCILPYPSIIEVLRPGPPHLDPVFRMTVSRVHKVFFGLIRSKRSILHHQAVTRVAFESENKEIGQKFWSTVHIYASS